jgi:2-polyprenyl-3-methyl-5-hydroxy-6-metoxy-1,4-benzoquinol methylase
MDAIPPKAPTHSSCPLCASERLKPLPRYPVAGLVHCLDCGVQFTSRRPSDDELARHYRDYGTEMLDSPVTRQRYRELLDSFEPYRRTNRILDFGCGLGYFLEEAEARGWEAHGCEFSSRALDGTAEKGLKVVRAPVGPGTFDRDAFDVVTAFEVVEHLREPALEAGTITEALRPGGLFYCTTPNFGALARRVVGERWVIIEYPEHLFYFTGASLRRWLERFDLHAVSIIATGFSPSTLRRSVAPADAPSKRAGPGGDENLRLAVEQSRALQLMKSTVNRTLSLLMLGETLKGRFELGPSSVG